MDMRVEKGLKIYTKCIPNNINIHVYAKAETSLFRQRSILSKLWFFNSFQFFCAFEELMLLNCGVGEDSCESLAQKGGQTSQS